MILEALSTQVCSFSIPHWACSHCLICAEFPIRKDQLLIDQPTNLSKILKLLPVPFSFTLFTRSGMCDGFRDVHTRESILKDFSFSTLTAHPVPFLRGPLYIIHGQFISELTTVIFQKTQSECDSGALLVIILIPRAEFIVCSVLDRPQLPRIRARKSRRILHLQVHPRYKRGVHQIGYGDRVVTKSQSENTLISCGSVPIIEQVLSLG